MASKPKIEWNNAGFKAVLNSGGVQADIAARASAIANAAGEGFESSTFTGDYGGGRVIGVVTTATYEARRAEAEEKALTTAIDAGR